MLNAKCHLLKYVCELNMYNYFVTIIIWFDVDAMTCLEYEHVSRKTRLAIKQIHNMFYSKHV